LDTQVAREIVAVATSDRVWVKRGKSGEKSEADARHADKHFVSSDADTAGTESEAVPVVILSTVEDFSRPS